MARPANPAWTITQFATDANYPAGSDPWSAQPTKVTFPSAPAGLVPNQGAAAEYINDLFNQTMARLEDSRAKLTELCNFVGQESVFNFHPKQDVGQAATHAFYVGATSGARGARTWFLVGGGLLQQDIGDGGHTFFTGDLVAGGGGSGEEPIDGDYDNTGAIVVSTDTRYVFQRDNSSGSLSKVDCFATAITGASSDVVYDPIHNLWCVGLVKTAGGAPLRIRTSPDRSTWTSRTPPFGAGSSDGLVKMACNRATGRIVLANLNAGGLSSLPLGYSDDGGVTWTSITALTTVSGITGVDLQYNPTTGKWMIALGKNYTTEIWTSADGITWSKVLTLTTSNVYSLATLGNMWVALAKQQATSIIELVYSLDEGLTWKLAAVQFMNSPQGVYSNGDQLMVPTAGTGHFVYTGHRMGNTDYGSLT